MSNNRIINIAISAVKLIASMISIASICAAIAVDVNSTIFITIFIYFLTKFADSIEFALKKRKLFRDNLISTICNFVNILLSIIFVAVNVFAFACFGHYNNIVSSTIVILNILFIIYFLCIEIRQFFFAYYYYQKFN